MLERFREKFFECANTGCWIWTASTRHGGYGQFGLGDKKVSAHRYSYTVNVGPIPDGMIVCHTCDTPSCVNPDHLFLGTHADNVADKVAKDRHLKGEEHGRAKLTEDQIRAIRTDPRSYRKVAADYGITYSMASLIKSRKRWKHVL